MPASHRAACFAAVLPLYGSGRGAARAAQAGEAERPSAGAAPARFPTGRGPLGTYEYYRGDLNGDGVVGFQDLIVLLSNYKTPIPVLFEDGDFDNDSDVDLADLDDVLSYYGDACQ